MGDFEFSNENKLEIRADSATKFDSGAPGESHTDYFEYLGRVVGMAMYNNQLISGEFLFLI